MTGDISQMKRRAAPAEFGQECPVCGAPFDAGSAGVVWPDDRRSIDAIAWVRVCYGPVPEHVSEEVLDLSYDPEELAMVFVHKDDDLGV